VGLGLYFFLTKKRVTEPVPCKNPRTSALTRRLFSATLGRVSAPSYLEIYHHSTASLPDQRDPRAQVPPREFAWAHTSGRRKGDAFYLYDLRHNGSSRWLRIRNGDTYLNQGKILHAPRLPIRSRFSHRAAALPIRQ